jgi:hypothetical protein
MNTPFILLAQYGATAVVPLEFVCRDYFRHLTPAKMLRKITAGDIKLPLVRMERSQKCAKGIALTDLAKHIDMEIEAGHLEYEKMHGRPFGT